MMHFTRTHTFFSNLYGCQLTGFRYLSGNRNLIFGLQSILLRNGERLDDHAPLHFFRCSYNLNILNLIYISLYSY
jgi:hypothetical protein